MLKRLFKFFMLLVLIYMILRFQPLFMSVMDSLIGFMADGLSMLIEWATQRINGASA